MRLNSYNVNIRRCLSILGISFLLNTFLNNLLSAQDNTGGFGILKEILKSELIRGDHKIEEFEVIYNDLISNLRKRIVNEPDVFDKHEIVFETLHSEFLKKYKVKAYLSNLFDNKIFNCATSVLLYKACCIDLNLDVNIYETEKHVYLTFKKADDQEVIIELTDPSEGFDFHKDKEEYLEYLLRYKFITPEDVESMGADSIYNEFIAGSKKISTTRLMAINLINYALYSLEKDSSEAALRNALKAVSIDRDSASIDFFDMIVLIYNFKIEKNLNKSLEMIQNLLNLESLSKDYEITLAIVGESVLNLLLEKGKIEPADSLFSRLLSYFRYINKDDNDLKDLITNFRTQLIKNYGIFGEYEKAYSQSKLLYAEYKEDSNSREMYINAAGMLLNHLQRMHEYEKMKAIADSVYADLPELKSVQELYISVILESIFSTNLYLTDPRKSRDILLNAYQKFSMNQTLKTGIGNFYREWAMSKIRERENAEAVKLLEEGLKYDPGNPNLIYELKLTKALK